MRSITPSTTPSESGSLMIGLSSAMSASRAPMPAGKNPIATDIAPASASAIACAGVAETPIACSTNQSRNPLMRIHEPSIAPIRSASRTRPCSGALRRNITPPARMTATPPTVTAAPISGLPATPIATPPIRPASPSQASPGIAEAMAASPYVAPCSESERVVTSNEPGSGSRFAAEEITATSSARRHGACDPMSRAAAPYSSIFSTTVTGAATKNATAMATQLILENCRCADRHAHTLAITKPTSVTTVTIVCRRRGIGCARRSKKRRYAGRRAPASGMASDGVTTASSGSRGWCSRSAAGEHDVTGADVGAGKGSLEQPERRGDSRARPRHRRGVRLEIPPARRRAFLERSVLRVAARHHVAPALEQCAEARADTAHPHHAKPRLLEPSLQLRALVAADVPRELVVGAELVGVRRHTQGEPTVGPHVLAPPFERAGVVDDVLEHLERAHRVELHFTETREIVDDPAAPDAREPRARDRARIGIGLDRRVVVVPGQPGAEATLTGADLQHAVRLRPAEGGANGVEPEPGVHGEDGQ